MLSPQLTVFDLICPGLAVNCYKMLLVLSERAVVHTTCHQDVKTPDYLHIVLIYFIRLRDVKCRESKI